MQIEVAPEIEAALLAESSATGLTPAEIAARIITQYANGRTQQEWPRAGRMVRTADLLKEEPVSAELLERRRLAVQSMIARRSAPDAPRLNLPEGMSLRKWMHEDHRYKD